MKFYTAAIFFLLGVNFLLPSVALSATVTAAVDRNVLSLGETFQLQIKIDTIGSWATPEILGSLEQDFNIVSGPHRSQRQIVINGNFESSIEWTYELSAKRPGQLQIPSFKVDQFQSMPITVMINEQPIPSNNNNQFAGQPSAVVDVQVDKREVFLLEQIFLTVQIYTRENIQGRLDFGDLDAQFKMINLGDQREYIKNMQGTNYQVHEFHFALFPKSAGDFPIGPVTVQSSQQQQILGLFALPSGQSVNIQSEIIPIKVLNPKKDTAHHLIGESVSLTEEWSPTIPANGTPEIAVGEPLTRHIEVRVVGQTESHIPTLEISAPSELKVYPDQIQGQDSLDWQRGVLGIKRQSFAIVPTQVGLYELPEVKVEWWNTSKQQYETSVLPRRLIQVIPQAGSLPTPTKPNSTPSSNITKTEPTQVSQVDPALQNNSSEKSDSWFNWLGWILWLLTIGFIVSYILLKKSQSKNKKIQTIIQDYQTDDTAKRLATKELLDLHKSNISTQMFALKLLDWAKVYFDQPIRSIGEIRQHIQDPTLDASLRQLEAEMYSKQSSNELFDVQSTLKALSRWIKENNSIKQRAKNKPRFRQPLNME